MVIGGNVSILFYCLTMDIRGCYEWMTYSICDGLENWRHKKGFILLIDKYTNSIRNQGYVSKGNKGYISIGNQGNFQRKSR
jgi:neutral trehalase